MNSEFALALHLLMIMAAYPDTLFSSSRLSELMGINAARIRKVFSLLREKGLVSSKEGINGGFTIVTDPYAITLKDIYEITQQNILEPKCHDCSDCSVVGKNIHTLLDDIFSKADESLKQHLSCYTIGSLLDYRG